MVYRRVGRHRLRSDRGRRRSAANARPTGGSITDEMLELSDFSIVAVRPSGPVFGDCVPCRSTIDRGTFIPALPTSTRAVIGALTVGWIVAAAEFWRWWLAPAHRLGSVGLLCNSALLAYLGLLPVYFLITANRLRRVNPALAVPELRVAIVVTKAPSEPWPLVRTTLKAMLDQQFPHPYDIWLCDEAPSDQVRAWCERHGVSVSTRQDDSGYHRPTWPRRTHCKEGNLAYFYDRIGYRWYDVVSQLDADHVPTRDYLTEMVRPFADPAVGYVCAPSVCDANADRFWAARGRVHREATFHGPVQLGHNKGLAPVCIGSHYAVRTTALRSIGGIGPELAEDFSTTYLLNAAGWSGAFAIDAAARGAGPITFGAMLTQEFQWSRSLTTLLMTLAPRTLGQLPWVLRVRFLFALAYYPLLVFSTSAGILLPPIVSVTGRPWIRVNYFDFLAHWFTLSIMVFLIITVLRRHGLLRPSNAPLVSWEVWLYALARWPIVGWGLFAACTQLLSSRPIQFKVTPKNTDTIELMPVRLVAPYLGISVTLSVAALVGIRATGAVGYIGLCLIGSTTYTIVAFAVALLHAREAAITSAIHFRAALPTVRGPVTASMAVTLPLLLALASYPGYLMRELGS